MDTGSGHRDTIGSARLKIALFYFALSFGILISSEYIHTLYFKLGASILLGWAAYLFAGISLEQVKKLLDVQRRFVRNVSHELRTPLAIMRTNSDVALLDTEKLTKKEAVETINANLKEVDRIINSLRTIQNLSSYENMIEGFEFIDADLREIASNVLNMMRPAANEKNIELSLEGHAKIYGNPPALEDMLLNLVKNAIAYTEPGGKVFIKIEGTDGEALMSVKDTGIGIPKEEQANIFDPFYRGSTTKERRGAGLGLSIVCEIARIHKASIQVDSEVGKGTTFTIKFPNRVAQK